MARRVPREAQNPEQLARFFRSVAEMLDGSGNWLSWPAGNSADGWCQKVTLSTKSKVSNTTRFQKGMQSADFIIYIRKYAWIFIRISVLQMLCLFKVYLLQFYDWVVWNPLWNCKNPLWSLENILNFQHILRIRWIHRMRNHGFNLSWKSRSRWENSIAM